MRVCVASALGPAVQLLGLHHEDVAKLVHVELLVQRHGEVLADELAEHDTPLLGASEHDECDEIGCGFE